MILTQSNVLNINITIYSLFIIRNWNLKFNNVPLKSPLNSNMKCIVPHVETGIVVSASLRLWHECIILQRFVYVRFQDLREQFSFWFQDKSLLLLLLFFCGKLKFRYIAWISHIVADRYSFDKRFYDFSQPASPPAQNKMNNIIIKQ